MKALPSSDYTMPSARTNIREPDASGTTLSLSEAVARFDVSRATLRRKLAEGAIAGAHKVPGPKGDEYRLPIASLIQLGYTDRQAEREAIEQEALQRAEPPPEVTALTATVSQLTDIIEASRRQLMAAEEDRKDVTREREQARVEAARLQAELVAEQDRRERAEAEAERLRARRWWRWR